MARKVLVTGGAGFIGSHLTESLVQQEYDVVVVDNLTTGRLDNLNSIRDQIHFIEADVSDVNVCEQAVEGCELVFHHAAIPSVQRSLDNPLESHASGTTTTANILWAAHKAGVKRVIFAASAAAYGLCEMLPHHESMPPDSLNPYAATKVAGEYYLRAFAVGLGIDTISLRYFNVYGPRQDPNSPYSAVIARFIDRMCAGERPVIYADGNQTRDFIYVDDAVQANLLAADASIPLKGEVLNVGCGQRISVNQLVQEINGILGTNLMPIYQEPRVGEVRHSQADISKIKDLLGFEPRVSLKMGLEKLIAATQSGK